jgi:polysaccharide biosynthesis protein PslE
MAWTCRAVEPVEARLGKEGEIVSDSNSSKPEGAIEIRKSGQLASPARQRPRRSRPRQKPSNAFLSPRELLFILFKHRVRALAVALAILFFTLLAVLFLPSKYRSEAQLFVRFGSESMPDATSSIREGTGAVPIVNRDTEFNTEAQQLRSRDVAIETVRRLMDADALKSGETPTTNQNEMEAVVNAKAAQLQQFVEVRTAPLSAIITVSYAARSPERAQEVVQTWVRSYLDRRGDIYGSPNTAKFFLARDGEARKKLVEIENQIRELKDKTGVSDPDQQKNILLGRMATLQGDIDRSNADLASTLKTIEAMEGELISLPRETVLVRGGAYTSTELLQTKINELRLEEQKLLSTYLETSPFRSFANN